MSTPPQLPSPKNNVFTVAAIVFVLLLGLTGALGNGLRAAAEEIQDLRTGDCFNTDDDLKDYKKDGSGSADRTVSIVPCDQPHKAEVYAVFPLPDGPYPGLKKINSLAKEKCTATTALTDYVGAVVLPETLGIYFYGPKASSWAFGDRDLTCFLGDASGSSTGSVRATAP
nr:septum formation family protein [Streptomyces sp. NBC_01001]